MNRSLKRFVSIKENPYHGLNFCQGTVSEMLERPGEEIYDVIRYFGERKKIFNVHFRNIKGGFLNFQETFPDNGDVDLIRELPDQVSFAQGATLGIPCMTAHVALFKAGPVQGRAIECVRELLRNK